MSIMETFSAAKDRVSAAGASVKTFLAGSTPQVQAAELAKKIEEAESELARLAGERKRFIVPKLKGDAGAAAIVEQIDRDTEALQQSLTDLRQAKGQVDAAVRAAAAAQQRQEAAARPARMAASRQRIYDLAAEIDRAGDALAAAMKAELSEIGDLAAIADNYTLNRWKQTAASQIRNGLVERFDLNPADRRPENNLLGLISGWRGDKAHWRVSDFMFEALDDTVPYFADRDAAEACRQRQARRGSQATVIELDGGTFAVIRSDTIFATRSEAEAALASNSWYRTLKSVIAPFRDGFLIVPADIAGAVPA